MIDCSHANSRKRHEQQVVVAREVAKQIAAGDERIIGVMIESHLIAGRQNVAPGRTLTYGQSITDACLGWEKTHPLLVELASAVKQKRRDKTRVTA